MWTQLLPRIRYVEFFVHLLAGLQMIKNVLLPLMLYKLRNEDESLGEMRTFRK